MSAGTGASCAGAVQPLATSLLATNLLDLPLTVCIASLGTRQDLTTAGLV